MGDEPGEGARANADVEFRGAPGPGTEPETDAQEQRAVRRPAQDLADHVGVSRLRRCSFRREGCRRCRHRWRARAHTVDVGLPPRASLLFNWAESPAETKMRAVVRGSNLSLDPCNVLCKPSPDRG